MQDIGQKIAITCLLMISTFLLPFSDAHAQKASISAPTVALESGFLHAQFEPGVDGAVLRVTGPDGYALTKQLKPGETSISADLLLEAEFFRVQEEASSVMERGALAAGTYTFEIITYSSNGDASSRTGRFKVSEGGRITPPAEEANRGDEISSLQRPGLLGRIAGAMLEFVLPSAHADSFTEVVTTKGCLGPNCVEPEDLETLDSWNAYAKIKRSNPIRLWFDDTSSSSPGWALLANDVSGVTHAFGIMEVLDAAAAGTTEGRIPFIIEEGAPEGAFRMISGGNVGINIASPQAKAHIRTSGDTFSFAPPELRLTGEFFNAFTSVTTISDATLDVNGTGLWLSDDDGDQVVKFNHSAGADSLVVDGTGVGVGTDAPTAPIHVVRNDNTFEMLLLDQTNVGVVQDRNMIQLNNNGGIRFQFDNTELDTQWRFQAATGNNDVFEIAKVGTGAVELELDGSGNLTIQGALTQGSDVHSKHDIERVDAEAVLSKLDELAVSEWTYNTDEDGVRHIGPMAQDFFRLFSLGDDETKIAPADVAGVALAAIQAQQQLLREQRAQIDKLRNELESVKMLEARLQEVEARLPPQMVYSN